MAQAGVICQRLFRKRQSKREVERGPRRKDCSQIHTKNPALVLPYIACDLPPSSTIKYGGFSFTAVHYTHGFSPLQLKTRSFRGKEDAQMGLLSLGGGPLHVFASVTALKP